MSKKIPTNKIYKTMIENITSPACSCKIVANDAVRHVIPKMLPRKKQLGKKTVKKLLAFLEQLSLQRYEKKADQSHTHYECGLLEIEYLFLAMEEDLFREQ